MSKVGGSDPKNTLYCSFCGKSQHEVRKLIAGPTVFVCDECSLRRPPDWSKHHRHLGKGPVFARQCGRGPWTRYSRVRLHNAILICQSEARHIETNDPYPSWLSVA
jgi:hypothetical protein